MGFDQNIDSHRSTLGAKDPHDQLYGTFYAHTMHALNDMYQGAAGKSRYRYATQAMSKYHKWLTGQFSNPELATAYARPQPPLVRRRATYKFPTEQRKVDKPLASAMSPGRSHKSDILRRTVSC